jgi:protein-S-isoprenylcysteine O-methyltransferase Ste14
MNLTAKTDGTSPGRGSIPRWVALPLALFAWLVAIPLGHGVVPWAISLLTVRHGWAEGRPGMWNFLGFLPLALGTALLVWVLIVGIVQTPKTVTLQLPSFLMVRGPYAFTRNPMYVGELGLWLGWALLFGSAAVLAGFLILFVVVNFVVVPREELTLESKFGQAYLQYKSRVPRWFGKPRPS